MKFEDLVQLFGMGGSLRVTAVARSWRRCRLWAPCVGDAHSGGDLAHVAPAAVSWRFRPLGRW